LFRGNIGIETRRSCGSSDRLIGAGRSGLNSSTGSDGSGATGVLAVFVLREADGPAGVSRFLFPVDVRGVGVFCGEDFRGCGVFRDEGCGASIGAPKEKLKAAFFSSRGLRILLACISKYKALLTLPGTPLSRKPAFLLVYHPVSLDIS
jgi:hypothetical protein